MSVTTIAIWSIISFLLGVIIGRYFEEIQLFIQKIQEKESKKSMPQTYPTQNQQQRYSTQIQQPSMYSNYSTGRYSQ